MECTTEDCSNGTSTYLCSQCVTDLQAWIDLARGYVVDLNVTIARRDMLRRAGSPGGGGVASESAMPWNDDADQIQQNLLSIDREAKDYALMEDAAGQAWLIQEWCQTAERMISGPEAEVVNLAKVREKLEERRPDPMPTRQLIPWLRDNAKITVTQFDIRNWARRGKLTPVERDPLPTYHPYDVLTAWHDTRDKVK